MNCLSNHILDCKNWKGLIEIACYLNADLCCSIRNQKSCLSGDLNVCLEVAVTKANLAAVLVILTVREFKFCKLFLPLFMRCSNYFLIFLKYRISYYLTWAIKQRQLFFVNVIVQLEILSNLFVLNLYKDWRCYSQSETAINKH